ncbi:MAG: BlaI/MecI/CopY family transcriptional regulator [Bacillota bacterium]
MEDNVPKITDAEWKVMEVLWDNSPISARELVDIMKDMEGWNKNTTYTVITRLIQKGVASREEPSFICRPLVSRDQVCLSETRSFLQKVYDGSVKMLVTGFLSKEKLSREDIEELKKLIESNENKVE